MEGGLGPSITVHLDGTLHSGVCSCAKASVSGFRKRLGVARCGPHTICSEGFDWSEDVLFGLHLDLPICLGIIYMNFISFRDETNSPFVCNKVPKALMTKSGTTFSLIVIKGGYSNTVQVCNISPFIVVRTTLTRSERSHSS